MVRRLAAILCSALIALGLVGCVSAGAGLKVFEDILDGYRFLYPLGWVQIQVNGGPDVVLRDLIVDTENVSVVINPVPPGQTLADLGTPTEVGYNLQKNAIAPPDSGRTAELVDAQSQTVNDKTYYILEYAVTLPDQQRHNLASVAVNNGKLYTLNVSTTESRWAKVQQMMREVVNSFTVT